MVGEIALFSLWLVAGWALNRHAKRTNIEIVKLGRETEAIAKAAAAALRRSDSAQASAKSAIEASADNAALIADLEKRVTSFEVAPKSSEGKSRTRTVPFRAFKAAAEALPEE